MSITEEFVTKAKSPFGKTQIFESPLRPSEFNAVAKSNGKQKAIRFIADKENKKLYIFSPNVFHSDAWGSILDERNEKIKKTSYRENLWGVAVFEKGMWVIDSSDTKNPEDDIEKDFSWVNRLGIRIKNLDDKNQEKSLESLPGDFRKIKESTILKAIREIQLTEATLDEVYDNFYKEKLSRKEFDKINSLDPTFKKEKNKKGKYLDYIYKLWKNKQIKNEETLSGSLKKADAMNLNVSKLSYDELIKETKGKDRPLVRKEGKRVVHKNIYKVYEDDEWLARQITSEAAAVKLGRKTVWCTAYDCKDDEENSNAFSAYVKNKGSLVVIDNKETGEKFQALITKNGIIKHLQDADNLPLEEDFFPKELIKKIKTVRFKEEELSEKVKKKELTNTEIAEIIFTNSKNLGKSIKEVKSFENRNDKIFASLIFNKIDNVKTIVSEKVEKIQMEADGISNSSIEATKTKYFSAVSNKDVVNTSIVKFMFFVIKQKIINCNFKNIKETRAEEIIDSNFIFNEKRPGLSGSMASKIEINGNRIFKTNIKNTTSVKPRITAVSNLTRIDECVIDNCTIERFSTVYNSELNETNIFKADRVSKCKLKGTCVINLTGLKLLEEVEAATSASILTNSKIIKNSKFNKLSLTDSSIASLHNVSLKTLLAEDTFRLTFKQVTIAGKKIPDGVYYFKNNKLEPWVKELKEEFLTITKAMVKKDNNNSEVFETPLRPREFHAVAKSNGKYKAIRFIADKNTKKIYIFPPDVFHSDAEENICKETKDLAQRVDRDALWGVAVFKKGKWEIDSSDTRWEQKKLEVKDFKWMEKQGFRVHDEIDNSNEKNKTNNPRNITKIEKEAKTVSEETYLGSGKEDSRINALFREYINIVTDRLFKDSKGKNVTSLFNDVLPKDFIKKGGIIHLSIDKEFLKKGSDAIGAANASVISPFAYIYMDPMLLSKGEKLAKQTMRHEFVHLMDFIKGISSNKKTGYIFRITNTKEQSAKASVPQAMMSYLGSIYEINAGVNELASYKKRNSSVWKKYNSSKNIEDLITWYVLIFFSESADKFDGLKHVLKKEILKNKKFINKIIKRLARENLLPEIFKKEKNMNNLDEAIKKLSKEVTEGKSKTLKFPFKTQDVIKALEDKNIKAVKFDRATGKPEIRSKLIPIINSLQEKGYYIYNSGNGEYVVKREKEKPSWM